MRGENATSMSGKGLRNFVVSHRSDEVDRLVQRVTNGMPTQKYKAVDYEQLKRIAAEKRFQGQEKLIKVKKIQEASKQGKERQLLDQHKAVWQKEFLRLNAARKRLQVELEQHVALNRNDDDNFMTYADIDELDTRLEHDFTQFKQHTADPIWMLREDLQMWVKEYMVTGVAPGEHPDKVEQQVDLVKSQQKDIMAKLENDAESLEQELAALELPDVLSLLNRKLPRVDTGIPEQAFDLPCPDSQLKASVLQEFILIDDKYTEKLSDVEERHAAALGSRTGGWSQQDHLVFEYVMEQYPYNLQHRRKLYMHRLAMHLPHKSRAQLVEHEDWWHLHRHLQDRLKALLNDWIRDRTELLYRAKAIFHEASAAAESAKEKEEAMLHQQQVCRELYNKVLEWREQKLEVMRLEAELAERDRQVHVEQVRREEEQERRKRSQQKQQVREFAEKKQAAAAEQAERDRKRLQYIQEQLAEQAARDRDRVDFREQEYQKKQEERRQREEERLRALEEKERVLEAIRSQVRPQVEADLLRVWSDTEATREHRRKDEQYINIQQPLYGVTGFTGKQVLADPRARLEAELRDKGLMHNEHARHAVQSMPPLQAPRRDMHSTVFR